MDLYTYIIVYLHTCLFMHLCIYALIYSYTYGLTYLCNYILVYLCTNILLYFILTHIIDFQYAVSTWVDGGERARGGAIRLTSFPLSPYLRQSSEDGAMLTSGPAKLAKTVLYINFCLNINIDV